MIHAREDYNRIQDPASLIGEDEPVFLIRAKDKLMVPVLRAYADMAELAGCDADMVMIVRHHAQRTEVWQHKNGCKTPDLP